MVVFDASRRPLYVVRASGRLTLEDIESLEGDIVAMLETRASYANIWDLDHLQFPARNVITRALEMNRRTSALTRELYQLNPDAPPVYAAFVMGPRIAKLVRFFHQMPPHTSHPTNIFATLDEAIAQGERMLAEFGVEVPPPTRHSITSPRDSR